ncbi:MAG: hypothetical protein AMXMBFR47_25640 [Planctomycetota bacterium]
MRARIAAVIVLNGVLSPGFAADTWPQWRGAEMNGVSEAKNVPLEWSESTNVLWRVDLPAWGGATPIVWRDRVFVVSPSAAEETTEGGVTRRLPRMGRENPGGKELILFCIDAGDGKVRWQHTLDHRNTLYGKQNMASPSPVTDGRHVWALTGTGILTCLDFDGKVRWTADLQKRVGDFQLMWGYASSPSLVGDTVVVQVLHGSAGPARSMLIAFKGETGDVVWEHERKTDARAECPDAYTTPVLAKDGGRTELIVSGADYVTAHDPADGRELWRSAGLNPSKEPNYRVCPSPVVVGDLVVAGSRVKPMIAVRLGGTGDVTESRRAWALERGGPDVPSPVSDGKLLYVVNDKGMVTCVDVRSGEVKWGPERTAVGTVSASPVLADGRIFVTNENAVTTVLATGPEFKVLATNELEDGYTISSPAVVDGRIYIRTSRRLYCIGK